MSAVQALQEYIFTPLGLTETSLPDTPEMPAPFARGYIATSATDDTLRDVTLSNPLSAWTAGGIVSTVADLQVWAVALGEGRLLSPETQRERLSFELIPGGSRLPVSYGLGIMDVAGFVGHNGAIYGYSTWVLYDPESKGSLVVLANRGELTNGVCRADCRRHYRPALPRSRSRRRRRLPGRGCQRRSYRATTLSGESSAAEAGGALLIFVPAKSSRRLPTRAQPSSSHPRSLQPQPALHSRSKLLAPRPARPL